MHLYNERVAITGYLTGKKEVESKPQTSKSINSRKFKSLFEDSEPMKAKKNKKNPRKFFQISELKKAFTELQQIAKHKELITMIMLKNWVYTLTSKLYISL